MFPNIQHYLKIKYSDIKPVIEVETEDEFIKIMFSIGETEEKAKSTAFIVKTLGSHVDIGGRLLGFKQDLKSKEPRKYIKIEKGIDYQVEQEDVNHKRICINEEMMTFIDASTLICRTKNLDITSAMDYIDNLPWGVL